MGQTISSTQFFLYGKKHFTQTGYLKHIKSYSDPVQASAALGVGADGADGVDLDGRVVVVTGANSGIGKEIATYAAAKRAKVYMVCRNPQRAEQARQDILKATQLEDESKLQVLLCDVSELHSVRSAVQELQSKETKIHALVCNAGVLLNDITKTSEGRETTFASHLLGGSYLLSQLLLPQLKAAVATEQPAGTTTLQPRVIFTTSGGMYNYPLPSWEVLTCQHDINHRDKHHYDGVNAYAYAKRGQVLLAERLARDEPDIQWVTAHPGWAATNAVDDAFGDSKKYLEPLRDTWQGAEGICWMLSSTCLKNGELYLDRTTQPKHLSGPFFSEGSYTKNTPAQVDELIAKLKQEVEK